MQRGQLRDALAGGALAVGLRQNGFAWQPSAMALLVAGALAAMAVPHVAQAQQAAPVEFNIPAQPLDAALKAFSDQSKHQVLFEEEAVAGKRVRALQGRYAPREALERLLAGAGIQINSTRAGVFTLKKAPAEPPPPADHTLSAVVVSAQAERSATTEGSRSYAAPVVNVGKSAQDLREIPQTVSVMSRARIEDQGLTTLSDVLRQTTGVTQSDGLYRSSYSARGMPISTLRFEGGGASRFYSGEMDMAVYDSVSVLRGADGLFGAGDAGGVVNLSLKRPQAERQLQVTTTLGSWQFKRLEADASLPLSSDGSVRGRIIAVQQDRERFYSPSHHDRSLVYGAVEADLSTDTTFFVGARHQLDRQRGIHNGSPRYADGTDLELSREQGLGLPWGTTRRETTEGVMQLAHRLSPDWQLKANLRAIYEMQWWRYGSLVGGVNRATGLAGWSSMPEDAGAHDLNVDVNLNGAFDAWGSKHDVLVGLDQGRYTSSSGWGGLDFGSGRETSIFRPVAPAEQDVPLTSWSYGTGRTDERGLYGSLRLRPVEDWSVIVGGRYLLKDTSLSFDDQGVATWRRDEGRHFVPYFGAVHDLNGSLSAYASTAEIYQSQATSLAGPRPGRPLDPVTGRNYEIGLKGDWGKKLTASAALYRVEKKGQAVADPAYPSASAGMGSSCCYLGDGYLLSQGLDLEVSGEWAPGWQMSVGYTYNSNQNRRSGDLRFDTRTPRHLFKAWTDYRFGGALQGLQLGGGLVAKSSHYQSGSVNAYDPATGQHTGPAQAYQFTQPGYAVWFLSAQYAINRRWNLQLNVNNVFDKVYYNTVSGSYSGNYYGDPRNVMVALRAAF